MAHLCFKRLLSISKSGNCTSFHFFLCPFRTMSSCNEVDDVILKKQENKGIIVLNKPKSLNALTTPMICKIYSQLKEWDNDQHMKMVIIKSSSQKTFCAGGDIKDVAQIVKSDSPFKASQFFRKEYCLNNQIGSMTIPYIALLNGIVMGGGVGLSIHGTYRVATEKAIFAMPETLIGFFPDVGGSHFLSRLRGKLGLYLALTGARLEGRDLFEAGIATHFVCSDRIEELERDLLRLESPDLKGIDDLLTRYQEQWESDYKKEFSLKPHIGRINSIFGNANSVEEIVENLKRDQSEWSKTQLDTLFKMSPTSLKVTFKANQEGAKMTLPDNLKMEFRITYRMLENHDFYEGVRALLIDKDKNPKWFPKNLEDISQNQIEAFFEPLPSNVKELEFV